MGITVDLNINLYELDVESGRKYLKSSRKISNDHICTKRDSITYGCTETFAGHSRSNRWITYNSSCNDCSRTNDQIRIAGTTILFTEESWGEMDVFLKSINFGLCMQMQRNEKKS